MQDNRFITLGHALGLAVIATSGACTADVHAQGTQDAENAFVIAPDAASAAQALSGHEGPALESEPLEYHRAGSAEMAQMGRASYYSAKFQGHRTASGEPYDMHALTAAHRTLPLGSYVRVSNLTKTRSVIVRINDRGPFIKGRMLDLSYAAASELGLLRAGSADVILEPVEPHADQVAADAPPKPIMLRLAHHPRRHAKRSHHEHGAHGKGCHSHGRIQCGGTRSTRA
jgi:rare lipoprotein A